MVEKKEIFRGRTMVAGRDNSCEEGYGCGSGRNMVVNKDMLQRRTMVAGEGIVAGMGY